MPERTDAAHLRYVVVGSGMMGREHIANIAHVPGAEVVGVVDTNEGSRQLTRAVVNDNVVVGENIHDVVNQTGANVAVISTPNHTHASIAADAIGLGLHVLVEKPLATSIDDCDRLLSLAATRPDVCVGVGLEYRFMAPTDWLIEAVRSGQIGSVRLVSIVEHRFPFLVKVDDWNRFNEFTGGTLVEKCCHFFDLMYHLTRSEPIAVMASSADVVNHRDERYQGRSPDIIDNAYVIVEFANGSRGMLELCMFAEGSRDEQVISVVGDAAKAEARIPSGECSLGLRTSGASGVKTTRVQRDSPHEGLHHGSSFREHLAFAGAIRGESSKVATLIDGLRSVAVGVAAHRSIAESRRVTLEEVGYVG